jgi:hypothetical protein
MTPISLDAKLIKLQTQRQRQPPEHANNLHLVPQHALVCTETSPCGDATELLVIEQPEETMQQIKR